MASNGIELRVNTYTNMLVKPCPSCGNTSMLEIVSLDSKVHVRCDTCVMYGPGSDNDNESQAVTRWNEMPRRCDGV